ncbi:O-methyltransferase [Alteromonas gilva]|uniref:Class I SAM-dependent methyltransferase n=1 Tax=Alteromonas gilva TaxID=2987522 RepID=A0ABT5L0S0_9ALTE|nr:class I SAM-dependent methyltransferase [Alteromonas gilva]MDC8830610.1 class I SAM-dependent methyltransferase [Alteromonas gilva]
MDDHIIYESPPALGKIVNETQSLGFDMASEPRTGAFLKTMAATKPGGRFLEIGTGTGLSAAWMLKGMDEQSTLVSIDSDENAQGVAFEYLGDDPRFSIICADGAEWLATHQDKRYDFIFADAWPGKFSHLPLALNILNTGGMYIIDDLLPQPNWPEGHAPLVQELVEQIEALPGYTSVRMAWASGLMLVVRTG